MRGVDIASLRGIMYLGFLIGDKAYIEDFFSNKLSRAKKALYSFKSLGCYKDGLNSRFIAFAYKQFCQSTFRFGMENLFPRKVCLNLRQNILLNIKNKVLC